MVGNRMVRIHMVGGWMVEVDVKISALYENLDNEVKHGVAWLHVIDRAGNGNALKIEHIVHIQEVQW